MAVVDFNLPDGTFVTTENLAEVPAAGDIYAHRDGPFMVIGRVWGLAYPLVVIRPLQGIEDTSFTHVTDPAHVHCGVSGHTDPGGNDSPEP